MIEVLEPTDARQRQYFRSLKIMKYVLQSKIVGFHKRLKYIGKLSMEKIYYLILIQMNLNLSV